MEKVYLQGEVIRISGEVVCEVVCDTLFLEKLFVREVICREVVCDMWRRYICKEK